MKLIDAFPSPATVCRCWTGTFGGPWSHWVPNFGSTTRIYFRYSETWSITKAKEKRIDAFDQWCLRRILNITWSEHVTNYEVRRRRRTGQPLPSDTVRTRRLELFGYVARAEKSQYHFRALQACISPTPRHTWWRKICANSILVSRQASEGHKTEQLARRTLTAWSSYVTDKIRLIDWIHLSNFGFGLGHSPKCPR